MIRVNFFIVFLFFFSLSCKERKPTMILEKSVDKKEENTKLSLQKNKILDKDSIVVLLRKSHPKSSIFIENEMVIITDTFNNRIVEEKSNLYLKTYDSIVITRKLDEKLKILSLDTFHITRKYSIFHKYLRDSIFYIKSQSFEINDIKCKWEYEVKYTDSTDEKSSKILVALLDQKLVNLKTMEYILNLDLKQFYFIYSPVDITILDNNDFTNKYIGSFVIYPAPYGYTNDSLDINKDGFHDFQFLTEHAGGGANIGYTTYLFNPTNKNFEYSEVFSGYNIKYDSEKNRISTFNKGGVDNYYYSYTNLKQDRKEIAFIERVHYRGDTIYYKKLVDDKIVKEKRIIFEEYENSWKYLERG